MDTEEYKNYVHEFDPLIYPRKLWIAVGKGQFNDIFEGVSKWDDNADAVVDETYHKCNKKGGVLIRFGCIEDMSITNITHESLLAALMIYDYCDILVDTKNQEHICYLAGWIAKCCDEVKNIESEKTNKNQ